MSNYLEVDLNGASIDLSIDYTTPRVAISNGRYSISGSETIWGNGLQLNVSYALSGAFSANQTEVGVAGSIEVNGSYNGSGANGAANGSEQLAAINPVSVQSMSAEPSTDGVLGLGQTVAIEIQLGSAVMVSGAVRLELSDGGFAYFDPWTSNLSDGLLTFDYTVGRGQNSSNLKVRGVLLPHGASIDNWSGNAVDLAISGSERALDISIRGSPPKVAKVKTTSSTHGAKAYDGDTITIILKMSEAVAVTGSPTLTLGDGGVATYDAGLSTSKALVFSYLVGTESTKDLKVVGIDLPNGATITDSAHNSLSTTLMINLRRSVNIYKGAPAASGAESVFDVGSLGLRGFDAVTEAGRFPSAISVSQGLGEMLMDSPQAFGMNVPALAAAPAGDLFGQFAVSANSPPH